MNPLKRLLIRTPRGRQWAYRLLTEGYQRKRKAYDNDPHVLPSVKAKRERELAWIQESVSELEQHDQAALEAHARSTHTQ